MENLHLFEIPWIILFQQHVEGTLFWRSISYLGAEVFYLLIPGLYLGVHKRGGVRFLALFALCGGVSHLLKQYLHWPRPHWVDSRIVAFSPIDSSYAMPSGHALLSAALWLFLAVEFRRRWTVAAALALTLLIDLSRVYLGVHFPSDVVAGNALGLLLLACFSRLWPKVEPRLAVLRPGAVMGLGVAVSLLITAAHSGVLYHIQGEVDPASWGVDPILIRSLDSKTAGLVLGFGVGLGMALKHGLTRTHPCWRHRFFEFLLGGVFLAIFLLWMREAIKLTSPLWSARTEYPRAALAGFCVSFVAPWLGRLRKVAETQRDS